MLEVRLNSPQPLASIAALADPFGTLPRSARAPCSTYEDVARVADQGGRLHRRALATPRVIAEAKRWGSYLPGVATPTEAFPALAAGADGLKMFPAEQLPPAVVKAWRAVLPKSTLLFPVGSIGPDSMAAYWAAGASGFGTGSGLYRPGRSAEAVAAAAAAFAAAFRALPARTPAPPA